MFKNQASTANESIGLYWSDGGVGPKGEIPQENAVADTAGKIGARPRPADLRLHFGPYFLRIIAGKERRSPERLKQDRKENPAFTLRNLPLIMLIWFLSGAALLFFLGRTLDIIAQM